MSTATITVRHPDPEAEIPTAEVPEGTSAVDALKAMKAIRGQIVAASVTAAGASEPTEWDLDRAVPDGATVDAIYATTEQGRAILRHSVAHLMAQAVTELYPEAKFGIGPPVENGFYYDFDVAKPFTPDDLEKIEARMGEIMKSKQRFVREELSVEQAKEIFADQPYKLEIIEKLDASEVAVGGMSDAPEGAREGDHAHVTFTVYRNCQAPVDGEEPDCNDSWVDLCKGPHIPSSDRVPAFKLLRTAGAYWRGQESRPMLQRIYGTAWESRNALTEHLTQLEEAAKRDHRKLGRELELTHFPEELGPGLSIFLPKGAMVRKLMEDWIRDEVLARGYEAVYTPHIAKEELWEISGHLENYAELMYPGIEVDGSEPDAEGKGGKPGHAYRLKPMNCPFHILAYKSRTRSYRELPVRLSELGTVYRYEKSGVVNGQLRARGFTQDDSHIFCREDQVVDEVFDCVQFARDLFTTFGFGDPSRVAISTRPEKSIGSDEQWDTAEKALIEAVERSGLPYEIDPGEGAFYGPKIDIHARDAIGREWQLTTVQVDFNLPERFDVNYVGQDGAEHRPFMVHRALFGSIERFFAVMVESFNGAFPTWLAPVQANVVPVASDFDEYAAEVAAALHAVGMRVEIDHSDDTLGNKIRKSTTSKIPFTLIVGGDERDAKTVSIRPYVGKQRKQVPLAEFVSDIVEIVASKAAQTEG